MIGPALRAGHAIAQSEKTNRGFAAIPIFPKALRHHVGSATVS